MAALDDYRSMQISAARCQRAAFDLGFADNWELPGHDTSTIREDLSGVLEYGALLMARILLRNT